MNESAVKQKTTSVYPFYSGRNGQYGYAAVTEGGGTSFYLPESAGQFPDLVKYLLEAAEKSPTTMFSIGALMPRELDWATGLGQYHLITCLKPEENMELKGAVNGFYETQRKV
ncbi:hypothetical protein J4212_03010 [Candidatus Woesearchaeota archaeon]|nr:hypothetical protein [Candidatus Woesearchaeota archaeon]